MEFDYILGQCEWETSSAPGRPSMPAGFCGRCECLFADAGRPDDEMYSWPLDPAGPWERVRRISMAWGLSSLDARLAAVEGQGWVLSVDKRSLEAGGQSSIALEMFADDAHASPIARVYLINSPPAPPERAACLCFPGGEKTVSVGPVWLEKAQGVTGRQAPESSGLTQTSSGDPADWLHQDDSEIRGILEISGSPEELILETQSPCRLRDTEGWSVLVQPVAEIQREVFHIGLASLRPGSNCIPFRLRRTGRQSTVLDRAYLRIIALPYRKDGLREDLDLQEEWLVPGFPVQRSFWVWNASPRADMRATGPRDGQEKRLVPLSMLERPFDEIGAAARRIPGQGLGQLRYRIKEEASWPGKVRLVAAEREIQTADPSVCIRQGRQTTIEDIEADKSGSLVASAKA